MKMKHFLYSAIISTLLVSPAMGDDASKDELKRNLDLTGTIADAVKNESHFSDTLAVVEEARKLFNQNKFGESSKKLNSAMYQFASSEMITPKRLTSAKSLPKKFFYDLAPKGFPTAVMLVSFWDMEKAAGRSQSAKPDSAKTDDERKAWIAKTADAAIPLNVLSIDHTDFVAFMFTNMHSIRTKNMEGNYDRYLDLVSAIVQRRVAEKALDKSPERTIAFISSVSKNPVPLERTDPAVPTSPVDLGRYVAKLEERAAKFNVK
jgi:hypothetical protein